MVNSSTTRRYTRTLAWIMPLAWLAFGLGGCEVDSFFDPSRTGRFEFTPTTIPILDRIDVIEPGEELWGRVTGVRPDDLLPSNLTYFMAAGDVITIEIYELHVEREWSTSTRRIDAGGYIRVPELGDIAAAGLTAQEFEDVLRERLAKQIITHPQVDVVIDEFSGFTYTTYGAVPSPGLYTLRNPDLRLLDVLAISGGTPPTTGTIYVIREIPLTEDVKPAWEGGRRPPTRTDDQASPPGDIEDLIEQLPDREGGSPPNLGAFGQESRPASGSAPDSQDADDPPMVDIDELDPARRTGDFVYDPDRDEWIGPKLILERVIEIPFKRLSRGDSSYNIVIRPNDRIYAEGPELGVVYIDGEVVRAGVYNLPIAGRLTLSRLVAAAGGLGPLAVPTRVDLTRVLGNDREATVRLNLSAIRQRTEPDLFLKPNDHIIIGTNWMATPLAVMRNGFRMTYGFGFLLDRNFGNDVFGPPPLTIRNN